MSKVTTIEEIVKSGTCRLLTFETVENIEKPVVTINNAFFLIYDWPDDPKGANTTIPINLTSFFIHNDQEYRVITKTTFYDFNISKFENLHINYYINEYAEMVKQALILTKQKIEKELREPLSTVIPFNFNQEDIILLALNASKSRHIDYL